MATRIVKTFKSVDEAEKHLESFKEGGKRLIKVVIHEQDEECDPVFGQLEYPKARYMAQRAYLLVSRCNKFLYKEDGAQQWLVHSDEEVKRFVLRTFCANEHEAASRMDCRRKMKFVCRIIGFIYAHGWYDVKSADPLAETIADMGRRDTLSHYIYDGFKEHNDGLGFWS